MPYLYLVRHGQPDFAGNYDSITDLGARQSTWLGEHFAARGLRFARVLAGTLQRQVSTCELVMNALRWPARLHAGRAIQRVRPPVATGFLRRRPPAGHQGIGRPTRVLRGDPQCHATVVTARRSRGGWRKLG
ncbi:MAG: histidine phosphatase family protein [Proteobacteria bacterium]|nr:histidine phosphatase family protein [Pseudomonadota bacterium]